MKPTQTATEKLTPIYHQEHAASGAQRTASKTCATFFQGAVGAIEQHEDYKQNKRNHGLQPRPCTDLILVLAAPFKVVALRHFYLRSDCLLRLLNKAAHVASADVEQHRSAKQAVFAGDHGRAHGGFQCDDFIEWNPRTVAAGDEHLTELLWVLAEVTRIADAHRKTLTAFDGSGQIFSADGCFDYIFNIGNVEAIAARGGAVHGHFKVGRAGGALGIKVNRAGDLAHHFLDLFRLLLDDV